MNPEYQNIDWPARLTAAAEVVRAQLRPSPLVRIELAGFSAPTYLKLESMQPTGSFKVRGALAAVAAAQQAGRALVTVSSGNHGLGTAYAAALMGARATIVVPETASQAKVDALREFDVDLRLIGADYDEAERAAFDVVAETGGHFLSAYTDPDVIAGQATLMREVTEALGVELRIVTPVGGGGLASGTALAAPAQTRVVGVEAGRSRAVSASMVAGRVVDVEIGETIADGVAGGISADCITPEILRERGVDMTYASEEEIRAGVRSLALRHGIVAEASSAIPVAAALAGRVPDDMPTVFVVTGRNIAPARLAELVTE